MQTQNLNKKETILSTLESSIDSPNKKSSGIINPDETLADKPTKKPYTLSKKSLPMGKPRLIRQNGKI
jgi:hypothetical protein